MKRPRLLLSVACAALAAAAFADVVPIDAPALVLKGRTLADVQANEISGAAIGTHMRPRNMVGYNKTMLPKEAARPARLRVEMQMMDSYHLKCIVLELFDGADGVQGRAVAARYVLTKDHGLGWKFVNADGSLNGTEHPLVTSPKSAGYGLADLTLVPRGIDVGGNEPTMLAPDDAARQIESARGVIARFAGEEVARQLALEIIPFDAGRPVFEVLERGRRIRASNGATLAKAFYTDVTRKGAGVCSWSGNRFDANVWKNGTPNDDLRVVSPFRRHLYMQPCTASYTTAFWDEVRWMREIDWMALHGYDLPNAVTAFEAILERVWKKHGLTDEEIEASFAGPAYLAFSRMSCVDNAISHLPAAWRKRSVPLQHAIYKRLRSLGASSRCGRRGWATMRRACGADSWRTTTYRVLRVRPRKSTLGRTSGWRSACRLRRPPPAGPARSWLTSLPPPGTTSASTNGARLLHLLRYLTYRAFTSQTVQNFNFPRSRLRWAGECGILFPSCP